MDYKNILEYQERLVKNYKYRPLPTLQQEEARKLYRENLPDGFCLEGGAAAVFSPSGLKIADGYNRIVIGDYGAMVEFLPEQMVHENIRTKPGQEYRDDNPRYSGNVKFSWLTAKDDTDIKIYFQKKEVAYAELVRGRYYVSVFECVPAKVAEKDSVAEISFEDVSLWLKRHGVFTEELAEYYFSLGQQFGDALGCAVEHDAEPFELSLWFCISEVCQACEGLTYDQFQSISYNLDVIGIKGSELKGQLDALDDDVRIAIELGIEEIAIPFEMQRFSPETVRAIMRMPVEELLSISRFSKVVAGHKAETQEQVRDVDKVIAEANKRVSEAASRYKEYEQVMA